MQLRTIAALLLSTPVATNASAATEDRQAWTNLGVSGRIARGLLGSFEATGRVTNGVSRLGQVELRSQIGTPVSKSVTLWVAYVYFMTYAQTGRNLLEQQSVEQVNWTIGKVGRATVSSRTRLEQRFQRGTGTGTWRTREQVRIVVPMAAHGLKAVVWIEPFVSLSRTRLARPGIDQVRSFAGLSIPLTKDADMEAGYLNQYLNRATGDRSNNALFVSVAYRF